MGNANENLGQMLLATPTWKKIIPINSGVEW